MEVPFLPKTEPPFRELSLHSPKMFDQWYFVAFFQLALCDRTLHVSVRNGQFCYCLILYCSSAQMRDVAAVAVFSCAWHAEPLQVRAGRKQELAKKHKRAEHVSKHRTQPHRTTHNETWFVAHHGLGCA